eukprot:COSAG06_NODE_43160_length_374_cov_1.560000_1_plen_33_part_01
MASSKRGYEPLERESRSASAENAAAAAADAQEA